MELSKITCDGCGADLTTRTNSVDYRLVLASQSKPGYGTGFYTDMMIYPALNRAHHFCGLPCLDHWRGRDRHYNACMRSRVEKWKAEKGTRIEGGEGFIWTTPMMPQETVDRNKAECRADALAAFPLDWKASRSAEG